MRGWRIWSRRPRRAWPVYLDGRLPFFWGRTRRSSPTSQLSLAEPVTGDDKLS